MIARSALPFSARNILDRIRQPFIGAGRRHYARLLFSRGEPPLALTVRRGDRDVGSGLSQWQRAFAAFGDWSSVLELACRSETRPRDRTDRFRQYCRDCGEDTAHEEFDEFGPGWYAQICRCRRCGREGMRIWPLVCW